MEQRGIDVLIAMSYVLLMVVPAMMVSVLWLALLPGRVADDAPPSPVLAA